MDNKQRYDQFYRSFVIPQRERSQSELKLLLEQEEETIVAGFESMLLDLVQQVYSYQQENQEKIWCACECAVLLSSVLSTGKPIVAEAFGEGWYSDIIASSWGELDLFFNYWQKLRQEAQDEAKRYMGYIHRETADRDMLGWLMLNISMLFPYFEKAVNRVVQTEEYEKCISHARLTFHFGIYRSVNEKCSIG